MCLAVHTPTLERHELVEHELKGVLACAPRCQIRTPLAPITGRCWRKDRRVSTHLLGVHCASRGGRSQSRDVDAERTRHRNSEETSGLVVSLRPKDRRRAFDECLETSRRTGKYLLRRSHEFSGKASLPRRRVAPARLATFSAMSTGQQPARRTIPSELRNDDPASICRGGALSGVLWIVGNEDSLPSPRGDAGCMPTSPPAPIPH